MIVILLALASFLSSVSSQTTRVLYVNQSITPPLASANGSLVAPFSSLSSAFSAVNSNTDIILLGSSYTVQTTEGYANTVKKMPAPIKIAIKAQRFFTFKFKTAGMISCTKVKNLTVKNVVVMNFTGMNMQIEGKLTSLYLFKGSCDFVFENIYMATLSYPFLGIDPGTNLQFKNFTINDITSSFLETVTDKVLQAAGTVIFDSTYLNRKIAKDISLMMDISLLNYYLFQFKNSYMNSLGMMAYGLLGPDFKIQNSTIRNNVFQIDSFLNVSFENSYFQNPLMFIYIYAQASQTPSLLQVTFDNVTFADSVQSYNPFPSISAELTIDLIFYAKDCKFYNNTVTAYNGILSFGGFRSANITIINSSFKRNSAITGGVIYVEAIDSKLNLIFTNLTFENNSASYGGVLGLGPPLTNFELIVKDNTYYNNSATYGGVFGVTEFNGSASISVYNSKFSSNKASLFGGVLVFDEGQTNISMMLSNNTFDSNYAKTSGGVLHFMPGVEGQIIITNSTFKNNNGSQFGAVLHMFEIGKTNIILANSSFISNQVYGNGSIVCISKGNSTLSVSSQNNMFDLNNTAYAGGVFYFGPIKKVQLNIKNDIYNGNDIDTSTPDSISLKEYQRYTGAIMIDPSSSEKIDINIADSKFTLFNEYMDGSILKVNNGKAELTLLSRNNTYQSNSAKVGGLFNIKALNKTDVVLMGDFYSNNTEILYIEAISTRPNITILNSIFIDNKLRFETDGLITVQICSGTILNFENNIVQANDGFYGGFFYLVEMFDIQMTARNNTFLNNTSYGGPIISAYYIAKTLNISIFDSKFISNSGLYEGSIVSLWNDERFNLSLVIVNLQNSVFASNSAQDAGLFSFDVLQKIQMNIKSCNFTDNTVENSAGIISVYQLQKDGQTEINILDSYFSSNVAALEGGIFWFSKGKGKLTKIKIENSTFVNNSAGTGALLSLTSESFFQVTLKNSIFSNQQAISGGLIALENSISGQASLDIINSTFNSNDAIEKGGLLYLEEGLLALNLTLDSNHYQSNKAKTGGIFYLEPGNQITMVLRNESYTANTADFGAVIGFKGTAENNPISKLNVLIIDSIFAHNQASISGGVFGFSAVKESNFSVVNCTFNSNVAQSKGGGVMHLEFGKEETIINFQSNQFESNSAISGGALNFESLNQTQIILHNNTYSNSVSSLGGAINFQSFRQVAPNMDFNTLISDSKFYNNQAYGQGGALAFILAKNCNITIFNCDFKSNAGFEGGGAVYAQEISESNMTWQNNQFEANSGAKGGVVYLNLNDQTQINLANNYYTSNTASYGGVGYVASSNIDIRDFESDPKGNSANFEGGLWYINGNSSRTHFQNMTFQDNSADSKGGCLYNAGSSTTLNNITFKNCSTSEKGSLGGALFVTGVSSIEGNNLSFINNQAEFGASIAFEEIQGSQSHSLHNVQFISELMLTDLKYQIQSQVQSNNGKELVLKDTLVLQLNTPFFSSTQGSLQIENLNMSNINCETQDDLLLFCLFWLKDIVFNLTELTTHNITSTAPLIVSNTANVTLETVNISNVQSTSETSVAIFEGSEVKARAMLLSNISSNFIRIEAKSVLDISNSLFDNQAKKTTRDTSTSFILLSESSVTIESTAFNFNSLNYSGKGGAVKLTNPTIFNLTNVNFTENKAIQGGALYIEGSVLNGEISNCLFSNNLSPRDNNSIYPGFGGAIYIQKSQVASLTRLLQQSSESNIMIKDSTFQENSAFVGGGIYAKDANMSIQNNVFDSNQATGGGGLAIDAQDPSLSVNVVETDFKNNVGTLYGASILQLREEVIRDQSGTVFLNETQKYVQGVPAKLKIQTFLYQKFQNLIRDINSNGLASNKHLALELDSYLDKNIKLKNIKSGEALNRLIEISVWDNKGNHLAELGSSDGQASLKILNAIYPAGSSNNRSYLVGNTAKTLSNGSVVFSNDTNFFAFPNTILDIKVSMAITHRNLGNLEYLINGTFQLKVPDCVMGEIFLEDTLICDPCKPDYFSFTDPLLTQTCQKCDTTKTECPGGSLVYPKPGYWRLNALSDNLITCSVPGACLGGKMNSSDDEIYSLTGFCNEIEGYEGNLCARCKGGFAKYGNKNQCTNCREDVSYYLKLFGRLIVQIAITTFNIYSNLRRPAANADPEEERTKEVLTIVQGTAIKVIVDYIQIFSIISSIEINWPDVLKTFTSIVSEGVPSSKDVFTVDCFFSLARGSNENVFFYKLLILNFQPLAFAFVGTIFWFIYTKFVKKETLKNNPHFNNNLLVTNCLIAYLLQPEIVKSTLQLFKCQNLGPVSDPQNFLEQDLEVKCGGSTHLVWSLGLGMPVMIFWLALPIIIFMRIMLRVKQFTNAETLDRYHFVFKRYKVDKIYWDLVILVRKALLIFLVVFLNDLYSQVFIALFVCFLSFCIHFRMNPYSENLDINNHPKVGVNLNNMETLSLVINCLLLFAGLYFIENPEFGVVHGFLMAAVFLFNLLFFLRIGKALYWVFSIKAKTLLKKKKKTEPSSNNKEKENILDAHSPASLANDESAKLIITEKDNDPQDETVKLTDIDILKNQDLNGTTGEMPSIPQEIITSNDIQGTSENDKHTKGEKDDESIRLIGIERESNETIPYEESIKFTKYGAETKQGNEETDNIKEKSITEEH